MTAEEIRKKHLAGLTRESSLSLIHEAIDKAMKEYARIKTDEMKMRHLEILDNCPIGEEISSIEKSEFNNFD